MPDTVITRVWRKCYQRGDYARGYVQFFPIYMETSYYMSIFQPTFPYIFSHRFFIKLLYVETTYPIYRTVKVEGKVKKPSPMANRRLNFWHLIQKKGRWEMTGWWCNVSSMVWLSFWKLQNVQLDFLKGMMHLVLIWA